MRHLLATLVVAGTCAFAAALPAAAAPGLLVGVDDDTPKWMARPNGVVAATHELGVGAIRIMIPWRHGQRTATRAQQVYLHRAALTAAQGQRVVLAFYGRARDAPTTRRQRHDFCHFAARTARRIPGIRDFVVWNEANNPTFWERNGGADYERLLARCWDALHGARRDVNVISSTAPHQDPAPFLEAMGAAYRASGRARPIVDTFGHNAYGESSSEPPWARHTGASIDQGDLDRLLGVLRAAFGGTAQPLPGEGRATVWFLEGGFETEIPASKRAFYLGRAGLAAVVPALDALAGRSSVVVRDQATQLHDALELAYCQPAVGAFFNFQLIDDHHLSGWQSGLLWADGTKKPSYDTVRDTIGRIAAGAVDCDAVAARTSSDT